MGSNYLGLLSGDPNRSLVYALVKPHSNDRYSEGIPATRIVAFGRPQPRGRDGPFHPLEPSSRRTDLAPQADVNVPPFLGYSGGCGGV